MKISDRNQAIIGVSAGDEGKGAIAWYLSPKFDYVVKYNGSLNAGHSVYHQGQKIVRRQIPSADFSKNTKAFIAASAFVDLEELLKEIQLNEKFFPSCGSQITIDPDCFLILPKHIEEDKQNNQHLGSTLKGVGPAAKDKINRTGTRVKQLLTDNAEIIIALKQLGVQFKHILEMKSEFEQSKLLFEGSQSTLLDLNIGIYPYVSCSDTTLSGIMSCGFEFCMPAKVLGISKAYTTKVGTGPFPTEELGSEADKIREIGKEYGSVTGRPRRIGWLDLPSVRYSVQRAGITHLALTKLDVLNGFDTFNVCIKYECMEPVCGQDFFNACPRYCHYKGWQNIKEQFTDQHNFAKFVELHTNIPVSYVSVGVNDGDIIEL